MLPGRPQKEVGFWLSRFFPPLWMSVFYPRLACILCNFGGIHYLVAGSSQISPVYRCNPALLSHGDVVIAAAYGLCCIRTLFLYSRIEPRPPPRRTERSATVPRYSIVSLLDPRSIDPAPPPPTLHQSIEPPPPPYPPPDPLHRHHAQECLLFTRGYYYYSGLLEYYCQDTCDIGRCGDGESCELLATPCAGPEYPCPDVAECTPMECDCGDFQVSEGDIFGTTCRIFLCHVLPTFGGSTPLSERVRLVGGFHWIKAL